MGLPERVQASFRDPAGQVFMHQGIVHRQVNWLGKFDYDLLLSSGLYDKLRKQQLLISHTEVKPDTIDSSCYRWLKPKQLEFISYPYEWSFSQLRDAAFVTLAAGRLALENDMTLKDASAYNVQFLEGKPILIDTLSFEHFNGRPVWNAYKQFCQHFLAPLALMAKVDVRLGLMLRDNIDGIPIDLAATMLPWHHRTKPGLFIHLWLHGQAQRRFGASGKSGAPARTKKLGARAAKIRMIAQLDSLERTVRSLKLPPKLATEWGEYYSFTNYEKPAQASKAALVSEYIKQIKPSSVWDLGGNDGRYSHLALQSGAAQVICFDIDPLAIEKAYQQLKLTPLPGFLPLLIDLTNPSPGIGWANSERSSLLARAPRSNTVMALALVHHLAIANNLPFSMIADYFARLADHLIIEFVPKSDSKASLLLQTREDIFSQYEQAEFEKEFGKYFMVLRQDLVKESQRTLYLMRRKV